jgi:peroxiredoxin (alkyl hydroperoxide reductase subunit C)
MLKTGDPAPDFTLTGHDDVAYTLSAERGHPVVLVFYPQDFSPTCETQHACLRDESAKFLAAGARVFGISVDSTWAHKAFAAALGIDYPLLSDFHPRGAVAEAYGVFLPERGHSSRVTFVVGPDGVITEVLPFPWPSIPETAPVLAALGVR